jgi:hypothetical protein
MIVVLLLFLFGYVLGKPVDISDSNEELIFVHAVSLIVFFNWTKLKEWSNFSCGGMATERQIWLGPRTQIKKMRGLKDGDHYQVEECISTFNWVVDYATIWKILLVGSMLLVRLALNLP